jgi:hypothetical protein
MNNSRKVEALLTAALSGAVVFAGLACREAPRSVSTYAQPGSPYEGNLQALRNTLDGDIQTLKTQAANTTNPAILQADISAIQRIIGRTGPGGTNTPLKVKGGSVTVRPPLAQDWDCKTYAPACTSTIDIPAESVIYLDGIVPSDGMSVTSVTLNPKQGWSLTLTFRDGLGNKDSHQTLSICTDQDCSARGSLTGLIYLKGDPDPYGDNWNKITTIKDSYLGAPFPGASYSVSTCNGIATAGESTCNHIYDITYRSAGAISQPYKCLNGECTITIGDPSS